MDFEPVDSSMIQAVGYDRERQQLGVRFHKGAPATYHDVPPEAHEQLISSDSVGRTFHATILGQYRHTSG